MKKKTKQAAGFSIAFVITLMITILIPLPPSLRAEMDKSPIRITDRNGLLLYEARDADFGVQVHLPFESIPPKAIDLLIAVEDQTFYHHLGVSLRGILRAIWQNHQAGEIVSGGSTITQQLVRNRLNPEKRSYLYKMKEALYALKLETRLSKKEILESYLNHVYFGGQAYGLGAASAVFFNKNISELSLRELSFLIGLIQSPVSYDPFIHFERALERQKIVVASAKASGRFTESEQQEMSEGDIRLSSGKVNIEAPHFVMEVMGKLSDKSNERRDLIRTTLDLNLQKEVELIVNNHLEKLSEKNVTSAAVVVMEVKTGDILAMVGSADYFDVEHDGAVNISTSLRQPGSTLKPFTYALALSKGDTAATTVADIETQFFTQDGNPYIPRNYDYGFHGLVRYREALANSYNIAAVKVMEKVGVETLLHFLRKAGIESLNESPEHYGLGLSLGGGEVTLLELTKAYAMLARGGTNLEGQRLLDERITWIITDILDDDRARLPQFGEDGPLEFPFPVAAKTGTTRNSRDNWTVGYTPDLAVGVWVGNADNTPMKNTSGITGAGPIFHETMLAATKIKPPRSFVRPQGVESAVICLLSGKRPTNLCPHTLTEWFIKGTEPREPDDLHQMIPLDTRNGLLAGNDCPEQYIEKKPFTVFPPELKTWARENGWPQPPREFSPLCDGMVREVGWIMINKPNQNETFLLDPLVPDENEKVVFEASADESVQQIEWLVNDEPVGIGLPPAYRMEWRPTSGHFEIKARGEKVESLKNIQVQSQ